MRSEDNDVFDCALNDGSTLELGTMRIKGRASEESAGIIVRKLLFHAIMAMWSITCVSNLKGSTMSTHGIIKSGITNFTLSTKTKTSVIKVGLGVDDVYE